MAIALSSIKKDNIFARHGSGTIAIPTVVTDLGNDTYQYLIDRNWTTQDIGEWKVYTSSTNPVLNTQGVAVPEKQIGAFTILAAGAVNYVFVMPWSDLAGSKFKRVESDSPPDDSDWDQWAYKRQNKDDSTKTHLTIYTRYRSDNAALPTFDDSDYKFTPLHANAIAISDTEFRQNLISGVSLIYAPKRDINGQVGIRLFTTAGTFTSITAIAIDANGALISTWSRTLVDITGELNMVTPPAQATRLQITFTRPDKSSVVYEFPVTNP